MQICLETLQGPLRGIVMVFQIHKTVFRLFSLSREVVVSCFLPIFVNRYFFNAPLFLENHLIVSHHVYTNVAGITQRVISLKNLFTASPYLLRAILRYFGSHFGACFSISWELLPFCLMKFCILYRCSLYYPGSQSVKKNFTPCIQLWALWNLFWVYSSMS